MHSPTVLYVLSTLTIHSTFDALAFNSVCSFYIHQGWIQTQILTDAILLQTNQHIPTTPSPDQLLHPSSQLLLLLPPYY